MKNLRVVAVLLMLASACGPDPGGGSGGGSKGSPPGTSSPVARNGAIAFIRVDPDDAVQEGSVPPASLMVVTPEARETVIAPAVRVAPSWSPDGSTLAYVGRVGIMLVEPGERPRRLTSCDPSTCTGDGPPAWSPDGRAVAFGSDRGGSDGLWTVSSGGGEPTLLAGGLSVRGSPSWSPDGDTIAVVGTPADSGEPAVVLLDARSGTPRATVRPAGVSFGDGVAWSPDGAVLLVAASVQGRAGGGEAVYLMRPDGSDLRLLTRCRLPSCIDVQPSWSPAGDLVVFTRGLCDEPGSDCFSGDLFVVAVDGGRARRLTGGVPLDCCAAWQPVPGD